MIAAGAGVAVVDPLAAVRAALCKSPTEVDDGPDPNTSTLQLTNLTISGNTVTWTHGDSPRSAQLG